MESMTTSIDPSDNILKAERALPARARKWDFGISAALLVAIASGAFFLGQLESRISVVEQQFADIKSAASQTHKADAPNHATDPALPRSPQDARVFAEGHLVRGYDMGVASASGRTDWVKVNDSGILMTYPGGQPWGAVFVTEGKPTQVNRPAVDLSQFRAIRVDIRGVIGDESVWLGMKDNTDPDDGAEARVLIENIGTEWTSREIPLEQFSTTDLERVYVPVEFIFDTAPQTIMVRTIELVH